MSCSEFVEACVGMGGGGGGGAWWLDNVGSQFSNGWGIAPGIFRILLYGYDEH